uniref:Uncharacterized protein n=1 Tax=Rhizophora mucronata TaxID=61149 RepID=A0A2P2PDN4_RHIMU
MHGDVWDPNHIGSHQHRRVLLPEEQVWKVNSDYQPLFPRKELSFYAANFQVGLFLFFLSLHRKCEI